jgi:hypothetical protein
MVHHEFAGSDQAGTYTVLIAREGEPYPLLLTGDYRREGPRGRDHDRQLRVGRIRRPGHGRAAPPGQVTQIDTLPSGLDPFAY